MDPLVTMQSTFILITMTAGGVASPLSLGEDVVFTRPSLQYIDRIQRMSLYTTREEVEVTESDTGQHSEKVQQRSPSMELDR